MLSSISTVTPYLKFAVLFYFFSPKKATEDLEKNKEKGQVRSQVQNSFIVRTDDVGQGLRMDMTKLFKTMSVVEWVNRE